MLPLFDSKTFALGASFLLASAVGGYILWGPSDSRKRKKKRQSTGGLCPGLQNTGSSCFLNANLQALAPCVSFCKWLSSRTSNVLASNTFAATLNKVLTVLNSDAEADEEYCPIEVITALKQKNWVIPVGENDTHELYMAMITTLDEDSEKESTPLFDVSWVEGEDQGELSGAASVLLRDCSQNSMPDINDPPPLRGQMAHLLGCKMCQYKYPVRCEPFEGITLNIPPRSHSSGRLTLDTLLRFWAMPETIQGASCENCKSEKTVMVKMTKVARLPQNLCLNIQQILMSGGGVPVKNESRVLFPEVLQMGDYMYKGSHSYSVHRPTSLMDSTRLLGGKNGYKVKPYQTPTLRSPCSRPLNLLKARNYYTRNTVNSLNVGLSMGTRDSLSDTAQAAVEQLAHSYQEETATEVHNTPYKLVSVIVHIGNAETGHFITYRRVAARNGQRFPDKWLYTSDTIVREVPISEVLNTQPYMLFYERI